MTTQQTPPELTPGQQRTAAARAKRSRDAEQKWADTLRGRGWAVITPELAAALKAPGAGPTHNPGDGCRYCDGYWSALADVLGDAGPVVGGE